MAVSCFNERYVEGIRLTVNLTWHKSPSHPWNKSTFRRLFSTLLQDSIYSHFFFFLFLSIRYSRWLDFSSWIFKGLTRGFFCIYTTFPLARCYFFRFTGFSYLRRIVRAVNIVTCYNATTSVMRQFTECILPFPSYFFIHISLESESNEEPLILRGKINRLLSLYFIFLFLSLFLLPQLYYTNSNSYRMYYLCTLFYSYLLFSFTRLRVRSNNITNTSGRLLW